MNVIKFTTLLGNISLAIKLKKKDLLLGDILLAISKGENSLLRDVSLMI